MKYKTKQRVVYEAWLAVMDDPAWDEVTKVADVGLPLAYAGETHLANLTKDGMAMVEETYSMLLGVLDLDREAEYESWEEVNNAAIEKQ
mgnify:CR=1 FL=1